MSGESDEAHASNTLEAGEKEMQRVKDVVRSLPLLAVKDLLSAGVCVRCVFRLFGVQGHIYSCSALSLDMICGAVGETADIEGHIVGSDIETNESTYIFKDSEVEPEICIICLGILQFSYRDEKEVLVRRESAKDFVMSLAELVKQEGHQIDGISLEVSVPSVILENEQVAWLDLKRKYGSEPWFQQWLLSERISAKDALKFAIESLLETLFDVKLGSGTLCIRLTYMDSKASNSVERNQGFKRKKTEFPVAEVEAESKRCLNGWQGDNLSKCSKFPLEKVSKPCYLALLCHRTAVYFGGRYLKYSRNVSQTRWIIDDERMGEASVEEIIGGSILPMCQGDNYKFHAAGREDIDVRMLGSGRPFLVEMQNARQIPSEESVKEIETKINQLEPKFVGVRNLKMVDSHSWTLMREGEAEKQKQYAALVWTSRSLEDEDLLSISSVKDLQILQRTPIRVLHRRSPLEREKIIHWIKIERMAGSSQYFLLHLCTQAGTYIKEFVHGDLGRTHPSIGSILGCRAEILQLDVTEVKMDCFLDE
ncbi:tRNA pseudouridine synthase Pus10 isoform X2 [Tripterygium wilfordii]|uniref:tRNA pseudouridine synthase Pus10 isoform X2 n=1 Tax=Tripterygium wilfordii TaxID=458696 RepID=UPI0018F7ECFF|nr:tRNA pseudouridine synthase Pus10 isoform X2 [Tripterygium wilfordii]